MKRFLIAIPAPDGGIEVYPMKAWLREHPSELPPGSDPTSDTSHQLRNALKKHGWAVQEDDHEVRLVRRADLSALPQIEQVLGEDGDDDEEGDVQSHPSFALEYQLRDFLAQNIQRFPIDGSTRGSDRPRRH